MEPREAMPGFGTGPDLETFERVWKRVMPDETHSPIVVKSPQNNPPRPQPMPPQNNPPRPQPMLPQNNPPRPQPMPPQNNPPRPQPMPPQNNPPRPQPMPPQNNQPWPQPMPPQNNPPRPQQPQQESVETISMPEGLEQLIQNLCHGIGMLTGIVGTHGAPPVWSILETQRQQTLRRLGTLYFLNTGRNTTCRPEGKRQQGSMAQLLRQQYVWEQDWERQCSQLERRSRDEEFSQLCRSLTLQARERRQRIREALERMEAYGSQMR